MLSKRLKELSKFLEPTDKVVDIGCDHGYLGIYAIKEKLVESIILTDIKKTALDMARKNAIKNNIDIPMVISDGLANVKADDINTVVISGMGTSTILHILSNKEKLVKVNKLILQSNNNLDTLRYEVLKLGYQLIDEKTIKDNDIWYVVCCFKRIDNPFLDENTIKYGLIKKDKIDYFKYLIDNKKEILKRLENSQNNKLKEDIYTEIKTLNKLLEECWAISTD